MAKFHTIGFVLGLLIFISVNYYSVNMQEKRQVPIAVMELKLATERSSRLAHTISVMSGQKKEIAWAYSTVKICKAYNKSSATNAISKFEDEAFAVSYAVRRDKEILKLASVESPSSGSREKLPLAYRAGDFCDKVPQDRGFALTTNRKVLTELHALGFDPDGVASIHRPEWVDYSGRLEKTKILELIEQYKAGASTED